MNWVLRKQAEYAADQNPNPEFEPDEEDDDEDEDDDDPRKKRSNKARKPVQKDSAYNILRDVVDPLRKSLSAASDMYFRGTAETGIEPVSCCTVHNGFILCGERRLFVFRTADMGYRNSIAC